MRNEAGVIFWRSVPASEVCAMFGERGVDLGAVAAGSGTGGGDWIVLCQSQWREQKKTERERSGE